MENRVFDRRRTVITLSNREQADYATARIQTLSCAGGKPESPVLWDAIRLRLPRKAVRSRIDEMQELTHEQII
jgi:hypothetical protein